VLHPGGISQGVLFLHGKKAETKKGRGDESLGGELQKIKVSSIVIGLRSLTPKNRKNQTALFTTQRRGQNP